MKWNYNKLLMIHKIINQKIKKLIKKKNQFKKLKKIISEINNLPDLIWKTMITITWMNLSKEKKK